MKEEKVDTGIFVTTTVKSEGWRESYKAAKEILGWTIHSELKQWEAEALRILRENGFDKFPCELLESAPPAARDAVDLMYEIMGTRDFIKRNDAANAALCAFRAGHIATRMMIRPAEKPAVKGRDVLAYYANKREAKKKKAQPRIKAITDTYRGIKDSYGPDCPKDAELYQEVCDTPTIKRKYPKLTARQVEGIIYRAFKQTAT